MAAAGLDLASYLPLVDRFGKVCSLVSFAPVVVAARSRLHARPLRDAHRAGGGSETAGTAAAEPRRIPLGVASLSLLIASEVARAVSIFRPVGEKMRSRRFDAVVAAAKAAGKAAPAGGTAGGFVDSALAVCTAFLEKAEVFDSVHSLLMLCALSTVGIICAFGLCTGGLTTQAAVRGEELGGSRPRAASLKIAVGVIWCTGVFLYFHQISMKKVVHSLLSSGGLLEAMYLPLVVAALLTALRRAKGPSGGGDDRPPPATPPLFAALQLAALTARVWGDLAEGRIKVPPSAKLLAADTALASLAELASTRLLPSLLGVVSLVAHIQDDLCALFATMALSVCGSPVFLAMCWPRVVRLAMPRVAAGDEAAQLLAVTSVALACSTLVVTMAGGTQGVLAIVIFMQAVAFAYGDRLPEILGSTA